MNEQNGENLIIEPQVKIEKPEAVIEIVKDLDEALKSEDESTVRQILERKENWQNIITRRGKKMENIDTLENAFDFLLEKEFAKISEMKKTGERTNLENVKVKDLLQWLKESGMSQEVLPELMSIAYHRRDDIKFFKILSIILENKREINNNKVLGEALHHFASWQSSVLEKKDIAININEEVKKLIGNEKEQYAIKAQYGIMHNMNLKPRKRVEVFEKIKERFLAIGDELNSLQAMNESAKAYLELAKNQNNMTPETSVKESHRKLKSQAEGNFLLAKDLALESLGKASDLGYSNAEIRAREILSEFYHQMGDIKKAKSYKRSADGLRKNFNYKTM